MMKLSLHHLILGSLIFVGPSALSSDNDRPVYKQFKGKPLPRIPTQTQTPPSTRTQISPQEAPRKIVTNPFLQRMQQAGKAEKEEQKIAKASYPQRFTAEEIQLFINAPIIKTADNKNKRKAVPIGGMKVSVKNIDGLLNDIKETICGHRVQDATQIVVPDSITAEIYSDPLDPKYNGGTAQEETRKTGKLKIGALRQYKLMQYGQQLMYTPKMPFAQPCPAKLALSITTDATTKE